MAVDWLSLLPVVAAFVSGLASAYLLSGLRRLPPVRRRKLLARQLTYLAIADLCFSIVEVSHRALDIVKFQVATPETVKNWYCIIVQFLREVPAEASLILECHLALTFAASIFKSSRALRVLGRCLPYVWLLAIGLAIGSLPLSKPQWLDDQKHCGYANGRAWVFVASIWTVFAACSISYIICTVYVTTAAGGRVRQSVGARAQAYLLVAALTNGPIALYYTLPDGVFEGEPLKIWFWTSTTLFNFSGFMHFAIYAHQCRQVRKLVEGAEARGNEGRQDHGFRVTFRAEESVVQLQDIETMSNSTGRRSHNSEQIPEEGLVNYLDDPWSDVSWFLETAPLADQSASLQRATGGQWSPADFAGSSDDSSVVTAGSAPSGGGNN